MKVRLTRNIHHNNSETGLTSKTVFKDYEWNIPPVLGATIDDVAWHRSDIVKIENINITPEYADCYEIELTNMKVNRVNQVNEQVDIVKKHGWEVIILR